MFWRIIIIFLLSTGFGFGQIPGDLNCDGTPFLISDLIWLSNFMVDCSVDTMPDCTEENSDLDGDGMNLTVADIFLLIHTQINGYPYTPPQYSSNPDLDTLMIESTEASPGDQITLPVYLKTTDTLTAFQFYLVSDTSYITLDSITAASGLFISYSDCWHTIHCIVISDTQIDTVVILPGTYHVANLHATVNPDIYQPYNAFIQFSSYQSHAYFTGLANTAFFLPALVDAEISISPTGINPNNDANIPVKSSIDAYPNPFNDKLRLEVTSDCQSKLAIYDILGNHVRSYLIYPGINSLIWDATDQAGLTVGSGVYFALLKNRSDVDIKKIILLR